jgi:hypothetical protein
MSYLDDNILSDPNHPEYRDELQRLHDEHEANLEMEADLNGTGTQMYKDTLMLLGRVKEEMEKW